MTNKYPPREQREPYDDEAYPRDEREGMWTPAIIVALVVGLCMILIAWTFVDHAHSGPMKVDHGLVFVVDMSGSMDMEEKRIARESHASAIASSEVLSAIREGYHQRIAVSYVEFANEAEIVIGWTIVEDVDSALRFASLIHQRAIKGSAHLGGQTAIGEGLAKALLLMVKRPFEATYLTVDVVGDGANNHGIDPSGPRAALLEMGATINAMPMTLRPSPLPYEHRNLYSDLDEYFNAEIIGGLRPFTIELRDIGEMPRLLRRKFVLEIG